jgi:transmembrane sensor
MKQEYPMDDGLLIRYLLKECSVEEALAVEEWLRSDEVNRQSLEALRFAWEAGLKASPSRVPDPEEAWQRMERRIERRSGLRVMRILLASAAVIALLLAARVLFQPGRPRPEPVVQHKSVPTPTPAPAERTLRTLQQVQTDTLPDRSVVTLNRKSSLLVNDELRSQKRTVRLEGEAFFHITPDKDRPFVISTPQGVDITVLGTSFNVKAYADFTEVIVETGRVQMKRFDRTVVIGANEMARFDHIDSTVQVKKNRDRLYRYFRSREFECDQTPLWKVVNVLNEAYDDSVVIANPRLRGLALTARFSNESLESLLDVLSETFEIQVEKKGHIYYLK